MSADPTKTLDLAMNVLAQNPAFSRSPERLAVVRQAFDAHRERLRALVTFGVPPGGPVRVLLGFGDDVRAHPCARAGARLVHYVLRQPPGTVAYTELFTDGSDTEGAATRKQVGEFKAWLKTRGEAGKALAEVVDCITVSRRSEATFDPLPGLPAFKII